MSPDRALCVAFVTLASLLPAAAGADGPFRKIGEMELSLLGVSATVDPLDPVVPRNLASGVRIVVRAGGVDLTAQEVRRFLGGDFVARAVLAGPGLPASLLLPQTGPDAPPPNPDPQLLMFPGLPVAGNYDLSSIRLESTTGTVLDVVPPRVTVKVIDQILVTSVQTRALTLDEIRERGIVLDGDDYLGFEFALGLMIESRPVNFAFPVVFDREGVPVPQPILPPPAPTRDLVALPTIVPMLLDAEIPGEDGGEPVKITLKLPNGEPVRIPSVLVIPGNVGYLKQFFSAQLFVANGAPVGSGLSVRDVWGRIKLPAGEDQEPGTSDDPLTLPELSGGTAPDQLPIRGLGPDGRPGTDDDVAVFNPAEQGQAEFLLRGELEGFHGLSFDIAAVLDGLPVGPVNLKGKASGGVLVRNPYLDVAFTVPSVVRTGERFKLYATVSNIGHGVANDVYMSFEDMPLSGVTIESDPTVRIPTIRPRDSKTLAFEFTSLRTGQVVASYLKFQAQPGSSGSMSGRLRFTMGIGERGIPLSPDTLVLPAAVDALPEAVVDSAMRVLGQAWSIANAPPGTLPAGVVRISKTVVTEKALTLAEAGLRMTLGQPEAAALRDLVFDFHGGESIDRGFDQLLRETDAGHGLARALGAELHDAMGHAGGVVRYEDDVAEVAASGPDFVTIAVGRGASAAPADISLVDGSGRRTVASRSDAEIPVSNVPGAVLLPLGPVSTAPFLAVIGAPAASPYTLELAGRGTGSADLSVTLPRGDGTFARGVLTGVNLEAGSKARVVVDLSRPDSLAYEEDLDGDGVYENQRSLTRQTVQSRGPRLVSASIIGPETLDGATPFGLQTALLFDRVVDPAVAADARNYEIPSNSVRSAKRQLSGRLVFALLNQPEGRLVATDVNVRHMADTRGAGRDNSRVPLESKVTDAGAVVTGQILNADGAAVSSGTVTYVNQGSLSCQYATHSGMAAVPIGPNGTYQFRYVRQDHCGWPFKIVTRDPSTSGAREAVRYVRFDGEQIVLDLVMMGRGSVAGTVKSLTGAVVVGARVLAVSVTDPQIGGSAVSDELGRYLIPDITVGPVTVRAAKGTSAGYASGRIERAGTTSVVNVTLDGGTVRASGTVRKLEQGVLSAVAGAQVVYNLVDGNGYPRPVGVTETDATGRYAFTGMPAGQYRIDARLNQRDQAQIGGTAASGDNLVNKDLVIVIPEPGPVATVHGSVAMPDGSAAADVIVSLEQRSVLTDALGEFTIAGVAVRANQSRTVSARTRDGRRWGTTSVLVNEAEVTVEAGTIQLSGLGTVEFVVQDPAGQPVSATVRLLGCSDPCGCSPRATDANGRVRYENRPLGPTWATAMVGSASVDFSSGSATLTQDGETALGIMRFGGFGEVGGVVLNPDGQPSHGADVSLTSVQFFNDGIGQCGLFPRVSHQVRTGQDGRFRFASVHVGRVTVQATQPFFNTPVGAQGNLAIAGQQLSFTLRLVDTISGELSGVVYLPDGVTPAGSGVQVTARGALPDVVVRTNDQGRFRFARIFPAGLYNLTAIDPLTGNVARLNVYLPAGQNITQDLRLKGRGIVHVTVVDGADQPIHQAQLRLRETEFPNGTYDGILEPANGGSYTFGGVFEGPFTVEASDAFGRGGRVAGVLPRAGDTVAVRVRMTVTGRVHGRFWMPDGSTPIPYGTVRLIGGGRVIGQVTTAGGGAEVGSYAFDYVPAGPVRIEAQDPATARTGFSVGTINSEDEDLALDVRAQGLGRVQGTVTSNGAPQPGAAVQLNAGSFVASTIADSAGQYLFDGVPEGRVVVSASLSGYFLLGTASGVLVGDSAPNPQPLVLDVALRGSGEVTGQVLEADGLTPEPAAVVSVSVGGIGGGTLATVVDPEGHFRFERVPAGSARLSVDALGSIDQAVAVAEVPEAGTVDVPIILNGVGAIEGELRDSDGSTTPGRVTVQGSGAFPYSVGFEVGETGRFRMPEVLAGPFSVSAIIPGAVALYGSASGTVLPGQTAQVVVQAQPSGTVTGHVVRSDGTTPAFGAEASVITQGGALARAQVQPDGSFTVRGIPLGPFSVRVHDPLTGELARLVGQSLTTNGQTVDVGTIALDGQGPGVTFVQPVPGSTQATLAGRLILEFSDVGSGFDPSTLAVYYNNSPYPVLAGFTWESNRATADLHPSSLLVGVNRIGVAIQDQAGNETRAPLTFTVTGATVRGLVSNADGSPVTGATVVVGDAPAVTTDAEGRYERVGLRPGQFPVRATHPANGLSATVHVIVIDGEPSTADIGFPAFGFLNGVVRHPDGSGAGGLALQAAAVGRSAVSAADGSFDLGAAPLGSYEIQAADPANGDRGRATAILSEPGQSANVVMTLNGVGTLLVTVRTADGVLVPVASVQVTSISPFAGSYTGVADAQGLALFTNVLAGLLRVRATDPRTGLSGEIGVTLPAGATVPAVVPLEAVGRIEGSVLHPDGAVGPGFTVTLNGIRTATTDGQGRFAFDDVPRGAFSLRADDPSSDDAGTASGLVPDAGGTVQVDITLNGVGAVRVEVRDSSDRPVPDAGVGVTSSSPFATPRYLQSGADGVALFAGVLAGSVRASAAVVGSGLHGEATGSLAPGGSVALTVRLQATAALGTIRGRLLAPNGIDAVAGARLHLSGPASQSQFSDEQGRFVFSSLPLGTYTIYAHVDERLRVRPERLSLGSNGQEIVRDLVLVGLGTVRGVVRGPSGAVAAGAQVNLASLVPDLGGTVGASADADGRFSFSGVIVGDFRLSAWQSGNSVSTTGSLAADGETVIRDLQLIASAVSLPYILTNPLYWSVAEDASVTHAAMFPNGGLKLSLVRDGVSHPFVGPGGQVPSEEDYRELVIGQSGLAGLNVTRKVFVPSEGYFLRYLDVLENPGTEPISVDVVLDSQLQSDAVAVATASGDSVVDASDSWVLLDDAEGRDIYDAADFRQEFTPWAVSVRGVGGLAPSSRSLSGATLNDRWNSVVVGPGETVAFLHLLSGQTDRARGEASAERLALLPPEVLVGMTPEEAQAIRNFVVPPALSSAIAPLPLNDGIITGRVVAGDGTTPVQGAEARFRSRSPYFGHPVQGSSTGTDGSYRIAPYSGGVVSREPFDVTFSYRQLGTQTVSASGAFPATGVIDITGMPGRLLRVSSECDNPSLCRALQAVDANLVTIWATAPGDAASPPYNGTPYLELIYPSDAAVHRVTVRGRRDGGGIIRRGRLDLRDVAGTVLRSEVVDLPDPNYDAVVALDPPLLGVRSVRLTSLVDTSHSVGLAEFAVEGESNTGPSGRTTLDVAFADTGIVRGRVLRADGSPRSGLSVGLTSGAETSWATANTLGEFRYLVVPPGSHTLSADLPEGGLTVTAPVSVAAGATVTQDLVFPLLGGVEGTTTKANGLPFVNLQVRLVRSGITRWAWSDYSTGRYVFSDVPPGTYELSATDPRPANESARVTLRRAVIIAAGAMTIEDLSFPPLGSVSVRALLDGTLVGGASVAWQADALGTVWFGAGTTSSTAPVVISQIPGNGFMVRVSTTAPPYRDAEVSGSITTEGQALVLDVALPSSGTVSGVLRTLGGEPMSGSVTVIHQGNQTWVPTDAAGVFTAANVVAGPVSLTSSYFLSYGESGTAEVRGNLSGSSLNLDALAPFGRLATAGQRDFWTFDAPAGAYVRVAVRGYAVGVLAGLTDPYLEVFGPAGALAGANDNEGYWTRDAQVAFYAPLAGPYTVAVRAAAGETGAYRLASDEWGMSPYRVHLGSLVTGTVSFAASGSAATGYKVRLLRGGQALWTVVTDHVGRYAGPLPATGAFALDVLDPEDVLIAQAQGESQIAGATVTVDIPVPDHERLTVTARRGNLLLGELPVTLTSDHATALPGDRQRVRTTDANGSILTVLPVGTITARAIDPVTAAPVETTGTLVLGTPLALDLTFTSLPAAVYGTVLAADGTTPMAWTEVSLSGMMTVTTDGAGGYRFDDVPAGQYDLIVSYYGSVPVLVNGEDVHKDVHLAVVPGRVTDANGNGAAALVTACGEGQSAGIARLPDSSECASTQSGADGWFLLSGLPRWVPGAITATAEALDGSGAQAAGEFQYWETWGPDGLEVWTTRLDLALRAGTSVAGTVYHAAGGTVAGARVVCWNSSFSTADGDGHYVCANPPLGPVEVRASDPTTLIPGRTVVEVVEGQANPGDVTLLPTSTLELHLHDSGGASTGAVVVGVIEDVSGTLASTWARRLIVPTDGSVVLATVPAGLYRAVYDNLLCREQARGSAVEGSIAAEASIPVTLTAGSHPVLPMLLEGPLGSYDVDSTTNSQCDLPPQGSPLVATYVPASYSRVVSPEQDGRSFRSLLSTANHLRFRRQDFVPPSAAFSRRITFVSNPGSVPASVALQPLLDLVGFGMNLETTSSGDAIYDTSDSFLVARDPSGGWDDSALVLGTRLPADWVEFWPGDASSSGSAYAHYTLEIPPGEARAFLTFSVSRPAGNTQAVMDQAQALADLTDPDALAGLTPEEKASIANFVVPPGLLEGLRQSRLPDRPRVPPRQDDTAKPHPRPRPTRPPESEVGR